MRWILITASLFGASSIIIGASIHHIGGDVNLEALQTALRYHQLHSVILLALGLYSLKQKPVKTLYISALLLSLGTLIFSGSLYAMEFFKLHWLSSFIPIGGLMLIAGWLSLAFIKPST